MPRKRTNLKLLLEEYFKNDDEVIKDDWLSIPYKDKMQLGVIKGTFYFVKKNIPEAKDAIIDVNEDDNTVWIHR
jgi:hypothetical protein